MSDSQDFETVDEARQIIADLERQLAETERALDSYTSRDKECPSWLSLEVTDEQMEALAKIVVSYYLGCPSPKFWAKVKPAQEAE